MMTTINQLTLGNAVLTPRIMGDKLISLGEISIGGTPLRNAATRFLPWFDTYDGDVFRSFRVQEITEKYGRLVLSLRVTSDPDVLFRERRDSSGDICFREQSWDATPLEADFRILFEPANATVDGRAFTGFKYWFEYSSDATPIHRMVDRQTWEIGGNLDDVTICLRNWLTPPRMRITRETTYSTVGLEQWARLLPGNLWGRWSLLPSFDMQYGAAGILLGWFDEVSCIRTVVESQAGEDALRVRDLHLFAQATTVQTNPKTILCCPDRLDDVDALNLWTRVVDLEQEKACRQFGIQQPTAPPVVFSENVWRGIRFDSTYEHVMDVAGEFGADYVFIDPVWEHQEAYKETLEAIIPPEKQCEPILKKFAHQNQCVTLDFEVANILGGEDGLKALCARARAKGVKIISWMATHFSPNTAVRLPQEHTGGWLFAAKESGYHPDTGYASSCWTLNLNTPILETIRGQLIGVCERTGMAGYLWDSFSNLGWWQLNYSDGSMRPQFDRMSALYADLTSAGLYILPEGIVTFSNSSCCGLHGGNIYADDLLGYSYNTTIQLWFGSEDPADTDDRQLIRGKLPFEMLFRCYAHKRIPRLEFHCVPRDDWDPTASAQIKELIRIYQEHREEMQRRTVLKDDRGVLWEGDAGTFLFSFQAQSLPVPGEVTDAGTGEIVHELQANRVYRMENS